jgi:hypothetical protein
MEPMSFEDFNNLLQGERGEYYTGRWEYYKEVIGIVNEVKPASVLELGPGSHTIVKGCDIMVRPEDDNWGRPVNQIGHVYYHDATEKNWPIADKKYDLLIALQVWEHLSNKQSRAFREVMRISKAAILSLPYWWDCPKDNANYPEHHHIDEELIADWTLNVKPEKVIKIARTGDRVSKGPRIIYYWKFV